MWVHPDNSWLRIHFEQITLKKHCISRSQEKEAGGMNLGLLLQLPYKSILISCKERQRETMWQYIGYAESDEEGQILIHLGQKQYQILKQHVTVMIRGKC